MFTVLCIHARSAALLYAIGKSNIM